MASLGLAHLGAPIAACGWSESGNTTWLALAAQEPALRALLHRDLPRVLPGHRVERRLGRAVLQVVGVGPAHALALAVAHRGYLPPLAQRAALAAIWEHRFRFIPGYPPPPPGRAEPVLSALLRAPADVLAARRRLQDYAEAAGLASPGDIRLCVAATEAMVNALRHAGGGKVTARDDGSRLRVEVEDRGPGIAFGRLARVLLAPRDAASPRRGYGFWLMLAYARECEVFTGARGTRVVLYFPRPRVP